MRIGDDDVVQEDSAVGGKREVVGWRKGGSEH